MAAAGSFAAYVVIIGVALLGVVAFVAQGVAERLVLAGLALIGIAANIRSWRLAARKHRDVFQARPDLSLAEVFETYYMSAGLDKPVVLAVWYMCADRLRVEPGRLRPTDRFDRELASTDFLASLDDPRDDLAMFVAEYAKRHKLNVNIDAVRTVDDLIRQLAPKPSAAVAQPI